MSHPKRPDPRRPQLPKAKTDPMLRNLKNFVVEEIEIADTPPVGPQTARTLRQAKAPPRWWPAVRLAGAAIGLALLAVLASLATRGAWPDDETRFLAIAWEMWARGDLLVPRLNGAAVAQPPLFYWLVHAGWLAFGTVEWWARLVPALFMLGSLLLAARLARFLWPGQDEVARYTPLVLLGGFYWVLSATLLTPDFLTVFFTLAALVPLAWMWRTRDLRVWLLLALALGLGLLASGSLVLVYVLPVALLAPLWTRGTPVMPWKYWYVDVLKATVVGLVIFAAWLLPAAGRAGYAALLPVLGAPFASHALALHAGAHPWWWPLALLPVLGFPWFFWPLPWLRLWHIRREPLNHGLLFCMFWALPVIALLAALGATQPQFLLPLVPAFFLVGGWLLLDERHDAHDHSRLASTMIFPLLLLGGLLAVLPGLPRQPYLPEFLWQLSPFVGVGVIVTGIAVGWLPIPELTTRVANMAAMVVVLTTLTLLALGWELNPHYALDDAAGKIASAQRAGQPVAQVGAYAGQFQFAGRLTQPLAVVAPEEAETWLALNPEGLLVTYTFVWQPKAPVGARPVHEQVYGDGQLRLWRAADLHGAPASGAPSGVPPT
jgi:4-amino-4-deoxy-L-arabinose transferase-like glycosyltransferase